MSVVNEDYPRFEKSSPSGHYQQISNFCVNYLEGMLVNLMHIECPDDFLGQKSEYSALQQKLIQRERTVRHAFQFQIEKNFSDFKSVRRTRLHTNRATDLRSLGVIGHNASQILDIIETITDKNKKKYGERIQNQGLRLKSLVHSTDKVEDDNPLSPASLCHAFLASVETLSLTIVKTRQLFELFDYILDEQLNSFYVQIDLGMYYLDIFPELTDPALFASTDPEDTTLLPVNLYGSAEGADEDEAPIIDEQPDIPEQIEQPELIVAPVAPKIIPVKKVVKPKKTSKVLVNPLIEEVRVEAEKPQKVNQLENHIQQLKLDTLMGTLEYSSIYLTFENKIKPLLPEEKFREIHKFFHFFNRLLNNALLSDPLKIQLSRLSYALVALVRVDPFFFRSSSHPVNDFIQSIVDFEIRSKHQEHSLIFITQLFDEICQIEKPTQVDFQPFVAYYEHYKEQHLEVISLEKWEQQQSDKELESNILESMNQMTHSLVVDTETLSFFYDDWQLLLLQIARNYGNDSKKFKQAFELADVLAWSLSEHRNKIHPEYERYSFASLLKSLDQGLKTLNYSPDHRIRVRKQLLKEYKQISEKPEITTSGSVSKPKYKPKAQFSEVFKKADTLLAEFSTPQKTPPKTVAGKHDFIPEVGTWVVVKNPETGSFKPARLNWKAVDGSIYLFINQRGHVVMECNQQQLNDSVKSGSIKLLKNKLGPTKSATQLGSGFSFTD